MTNWRRSIDGAVGMGLVCVVAALPAGTPARAQEQDKTAEIDKIFAWVTPGMPGCSVAASHHGKLVVNRAYGLADLERGVPISPDTLFDVASIRKQFIAAAVLLLVEEKRLSLSDDVRAHVPELPDYGHTITLDHMLTHTSGLRDWVPLQNWANNNDNVVPMILRQRGLNFAPGEEWSYSNSGYVLLAEVVARTTGMTFSEFARTRLFEPLGMKSAIFVDDLRQVVKSRALAYERAGKGWRMDMRLDDRGGGALFSTAGDLIIWNDALTNARLGKFVSEKIANNGRLAVAAGGPLVAVTKDRFRNARASTAFMSQDEFELTFLSADQFDLKSMEGRTTRYRRARPYAPSADDLKAFAGRYESDELRAELQITPGTGGLLSRLNGSLTQVLDLSPVDPDTFQRGLQTVRFLRDAAGKVVALELTNPALRKFRFTRVSQ